MQVTTDIHAIRIPFKVPIAPGIDVDRFVYVYLVYGERVCLIDCGVSSARNAVFEYMRRTGRDPREISLAVITHGHPDHMGGACGVKAATGCRVAAHAADTPWIEDAERQYRERPIPGFHLLVEGSVDVDRTLVDGDVLDLAGGKTLRVIHTPGHSKGHVSLFLEEDGALFSGDCIPVPGSMPVYEDAAATLGSIGRLKNLDGVRALLASWDEPRYGDDVRAAIEAGAAAVRRIHRLIREEAQGLPFPDPTTVTARVMKRLDLRGPAPLILVRTIEAHMNATIDGI